jgi:hypothetical protein
MIKNSTILIIDDELRMCDSLHNQKYMTPVAVVDCLG